MDLGQHWSERIIREPSAVIHEVIQALDGAGVTHVYLSNDIDGTDPRWTAATGTLERGGLAPSFVTQAIEALRVRFEIVGSDLVEVAPRSSGTYPASPRAPSRLARTTC